MKEPVELSSLKAEVAELTEKVRSSEDKENQHHSDKVLFLPSLCTFILIPFSPLFSPFLPFLVPPVTRLLQLEYN